MKTNRTPSRRPIAMRVANVLQHLYEQNRIPETWGTPTVSRYVFDTLRTEGFLAARRDLLQRLRRVGKSDLSPLAKCAALLFGVMMVVIANLFLRTEERQPITHRDTRRFSARAPKLLVRLYMAGAALLVLANDDGGSSGGSSAWSEGSSGNWERNEDGSYSMKSSTEYRAYTQANSGDGGGEAETEYLDDFDTDKDSFGRYGDN